MECPLCGCQDFFVKHPDDEFETFEFSVAEGRVAFHATDAGAAPDVQADTETYCNRCSWHGRLKDLNRG
jgi:hypothetical protein